jgi:hypothetical protein
MDDPANKRPHPLRLTGIALILLSLLVTLPLAYLVSRKDIGHEAGGMAAHTPSELEKLVSSKMAGRLLFNPPEKMRQGEHEAVTVRISGNQESDLTSRLEHGPKPTIEQIAVMPYMTVRLSGEAFKIKALMPENQFVSEKGFTEWRFDVQAIDSGIHNLDLEVGVRVKLKSGTEEYSFYPTYERTVTVEVDRGYSSWVFWKENWKWILGVPAAVAVVIKILKMIFKSKGDAKDKDTEEKEPEHDDANDDDDDEGKGTE